MNKLEKEKFVNDFNRRLKEAEGVFLLDYQGLNVEIINRLRNELKKTGSEFQVAKNRLLKLASKETETEVIKEYMKGPSAIALAYDDLVGPAKVFVDFSKTYEQLKIKCGQISGRLIDRDAIKRLAELPGRDVLLAQVLAAMKGVPASFVNVLCAVISNLLNVLKAIEEQKGKNIS
ncbi:MAG: 50S ribosomal protein L10 [Deltaproteobacteria bacterium]|nr:50S ribosomal protein L10 [Deltaproteobacteria bacterium]